MKQEIADKRVYLKINTDAIRKNIRKIKKQIPSGMLFGAVLKANAYGHGAKEVALAIQEEADYFFTATVEEALEIRKCKVKKPLLILGYPGAGNLTEAVKNKIEITVSSYREAKEFSDVIVQSGLKIKGRYQIAVDTGMGRIGFQPVPESICEIKRITALPGIVCRGIFTHFPVADMKMDSETVRQEKLFSDFSKSVISECNLKNIYVHSANSAAAIRFSGFSHDLCRVGISLYGVLPSEEKVYPDLKLEKALTFHSRVAFVKEIRKGATVSYGETFRAEKSMRIATVSVGYADGYPRSLSDKGEVLIRGKRVPIIGRICMDYLMVDVTKLSGVKEGDPVTLIGKSGKEEITVEELAEKSGRFPYEFFTNISGRVPRIYESKSGCF